jgi:hypothetical protein
VANTLNLFRNRAAGFIDWLDADTASPRALPKLGADEERDEKTQSETAEIGLQVTEKPEPRVRKI